MEVGVSYVGLPVTPCWVLVTGATSVASFLAQRYWVFAE
jgi:hypothetical protein